MGEEGANAELCVYGKKMSRRELLRAIVRGCLALEKLGSESRRRKGRECAILRVALYLKRY